LIYWRKDYIYSVSKDSGLYLYQCLLNSYHAWISPTQFINTDHYWHLVKVIVIDFCIWLYFFFINIGLNAENFCNRYMIRYMSLLMHCIFTCNFFVKSSDFENYLWYRVFNLYNIHLIIAVMTDFFFLLKVCGKSRSWY
jgi:hypothetical protein